jgi:hypothetical protein
MNRNLLSSHLLGEKVTAAGGKVAYSQKDLPRLWEVTLPVGEDVGKNAISASDIELAGSRQRQLAPAASPLFDLLRTARLLCSQPTSPTVAPRSAACRSQIAVPQRNGGSVGGVVQQSHLAVLCDEQVVVLRSTQGIVNAQSMEILVFSPTRLTGTPLSICWANDESDSLLIGTTNGARLLMLPSLSHLLEHASTELRVLKSLSGYPCGLCCASPLGRYALMSDGLSVFLLDAWLDSSTTLMKVNNGCPVDNLSWNGLGEKVFIHAR